MKIPSVYKRILNYIGGFILASCCLIGGFIFTTLEDKNLSNLDYANESITSKGITKIKGARGNVDAFYLNVKSSNQKIIYSNPIQNYNDLLNNLNIGDSIKVYFEKSGIDSNYEILQLEKNKDILISLETYNTKMKIAGFIGLLGGILLIGLTVKNDKKYWKK